MTDADKLAKTKRLAGIAQDNTAHDEDLPVYLAMAADKVLARAFPYDSSQTAVPARYETLQCRIAAYLWDKRGADGETGHTEPGVTRTYEDGDVPASILADIVPMCGVVRGA